jgi:hypothetical protein
MIDRGYHIDGQTFLDLQAGVTRLLAVLEELLQPPSSEERVAFFAKLYPIVETLRALLTAIIEGHDPEFGRIQEALDDQMQRLDEQVAAGALTPEEYRRRLTEIIQHYERAIATLRARRTQRKTQ